MEDALVDLITVYWCLSKLTGEQLYVVLRIFWADRTEAEVAVELSELWEHRYDRDRVHTIKTTAIARLRRELVA